MAAESYCSRLEDGGLTICLPFPPSLNRYYRNVGGRVLISEDGRKYRKRIAELSIFHRLAGSFPDQRLRVIVQVIPPDNRTRDLDNLFKCLGDSCTKAGIWGDDSQIDVLHIMRRAPQKGAGFLLVTIEAIK